MLRILSSFQSSTSRRPTFWLIIRSRRLPGPYRALDLKSQRRNGNVQGEGMVDFFKFLKEVQFWGGSDFRFGGVRSALRSAKSINVVGCLRHTVRWGRRPSLFWIAPETPGFAAQRTPFFDPDLSRSFQLQRHMKRDFQQNM